MFRILQVAFFARFFRACERFQSASRFDSVSFETLNILRTGLSMRSASVLPGTSGAGRGFMLGPSYAFLLNPQVHKN